MTEFRQAGAPTLVLLAPNTAPWRANPDQRACYRNRDEEKTGRDRWEFDCAYSVSNLKPLLKLGLMCDVLLGEGCVELEVTRMGRATFEHAVRQGKISPDL